MIVHDRGRLASLDMGRMIACLAVVLCHANMYIADESSRFLGMAGPLAVMFFMSLSGYVLAYPFVEQAGFDGRRFSANEFFRRRAIKILPAYYVAIFTVALFKFITLSPRTEGSVRLLLWNVISHLLFIHEGFPSAAYGLNSAWHSMTLEFQYYLVFPCLLLLMKKLRSPALFLVTMICFSISYNLALAAFRLEGSHLFSELCFTRISEFASGMALAGFLGQKEFSFKKKAALGLGAILIGLLCMFYAEDSLGLLEQQAFVFVALFVLRMIGPAQSRSRISRWLSFLGQVSYSTFLIHVSVGAAFLKMLGLLHIEATTPLRIVMMFIGFTLVGHVAGILYYYVIEAPGSRLVERWIGVASQLSHQRSFSQASGVSAPVPTK